MTSSRFAVLISISALSFASASELLSDRSSTLPAGLVKRHYTPELCRSYGFTWNYYTNTCVDTSTDVNNCSCVNTRCITSVANASPVCRDSTCKAICNTGYTAVDGMCKDQASDSQNCGRQGNVCQVVANALQNVCTNGLCIMSCKTGYVLSSGQCILKPSQAPRKRKLVKELSLCPAGETACLIAGAASFAFKSHHNITRLHANERVRNSDGYECLDTTSSIESCGGCASQGEGKECTQVANALGVGCEQSQCIILSCMPGYELSKGGLSCRAILSARSGRHAGRRNMAVSHFV